MPQIPLRPGICEQAFVMLNAADVIAALSSYLGIRRVLRIEPFDIFRG